MLFGPPLKGDTGGCTHNGQSSMLIGFQTCSGAVCFLFCLISFVFCLVLLLQSFGSACNSDLSDGTFFIPISTIIYFIVIGTQSRFLLSYI